MKLHLLGTGIALTLLFASASSDAFEPRRIVKPKDHPICPIVCSEGSTNKIDDPCTKTCSLPAHPPAPPRCDPSLPELRGCRFPTDEP